MLRLPTQHPDAVRTVPLCAYQTLDRFTWVCNCMRKGEERRGEERRGERGRLSNLTPLPEGPHITCRWEEKEEMRWQFSPEMKRKMKRETLLILLPLLLEFMRRFCFSLIWEVLCAAGLVTSSRSLSHTILEESGWRCYAYSTRKCEQKMDRLLRGLAQPLYVSVKKLLLVVFP